MLWLLVSALAVAAPADAEPTTADLQAATFLDPVQVDESVIGLDAVWMSDGGWLTVELVNQDLATIEIDWERSLFVDAQGATWGVTDAAQAGPRAHILLGESRTRVDLALLDRDGDLVTAPLADHSEAGHQTRLSLAMQRGDTTARLTQRFDIAIDQALLAERLEAGASALPEMPRLSFGVHTRMPGEPTTLVELERRARLDEIARWDARWDRAHRRKKQGVALWTTGVALTGVGALFAWRAVTQQDELNSQEYNSVVSLGVAHLTFGTALAFPGFHMWGKAKRDIERFPTRPEAP